jgi:hypothetical protein
MAPLFDVLKPWYEFYSLVGTASATLIGLLFVAASVGSGIYTPDKRHALRAFLSPSVVHFSTALAACLIAMTPVRSWTLGGLLVDGDGLFGIVYAILVWRSMVRHGLMTTIDWEDRVWYAALPALGYPMMVLAGIMFLWRSDLGCGLLALALGLLLLTGVRNAWDMTVWTVMRRRE